MSITYIYRDEWAPGNAYEVLWGICLLLLFAMALLWALRLDD